MFSIVDSGKKYSSEGPSTAKGHLFHPPGGINAHVCGRAADCKSYARFAAQRLLPEGQRWNLSCEV